MPAQDDDSRDSASRPGSSLFLSLSQRSAFARVTQRSGAYLPNDGMTEKKDVKGSEVDGREGGPAEGTREGGLGVGLRERSVKK